ncbi:MAG TPA: sulfite exporter TauE/SafE family protein [Cyclobacteriaceae bacterium]
MFTTPFLIGLASSLHCIGMCSPLVMTASGRGKRAFFKSLIYNLGRILTYGLLGSLVGFIGMGLSFTGAQRAVSITAGIVLFFIAIANVRVITPPSISRILTRLIVLVRTKFKLNPMLLGMINGILPCGMTLIALGYCITSATPTDGFLAMIYFGLGTLPVMLGLSAILKPLVRKLPVTYNRIQTALMILSAILLIGRGIAEPSQHGETGHGIVVCRK